MSHKAVILGMVSPISGCLHPDVPGAAGWRLFSMSGMSLTEYERTFERRNLLPTGEWDRRRARRRGPRLREELAGRTVIVLGNDAWDAMGLWYRPKMVGAGVITEEGSLYYFLPHPSGLNRFYNEEKNRRAAGRLLRRVAA